MSRETMRWWGWGDGSNEFSLAQKPYFWPWVIKTLNISKVTLTTPVNRKTIRLPEPILNKIFIDQISTRLRPDQISTDEDARLCHSYGKSYRDLLRIRMGIVTSSPDAVIYPENHEDVEFIVKAAHENHVCLIPFGGGTNIVGAVEPTQNRNQMLVSLHMGSMNQLLSLDEKSLTACFEVGVLGPALEEKLNGLGYSLGHVPDSFEFSTLGGWIATRSAGQQSDTYGKIEDMVVGIKCVTPIGTLTTRPTPASSIGPDLNKFVIGSEGTLGIITEATMKIHKIPQAKEYVGLIFPSFERGVEATYAMVQSSTPPSMIRLLDENDTQIAMHTKPTASFLKSQIQNIKQAILTHVAGYKTPCLMIIGFEGEASQIKKSMKNCIKLCRKEKGISAGASVGKKWRKSRFDVPYLRDFIMDHGILVDVAETVTVWSNLIPLYKQVKKAITQSIEKTGYQAFVGCHISHSYQCGASLYFTYSCQQAPGKEFEQYNFIKGSATEAIVKYGGSLSHHHAVGYEHRPWLQEEIGVTGIYALQGLKNCLDPHHISNPGKLMQEPAETRSLTESMHFDGKW